MKKCFKLSAPDSDTLIGAALRGSWLDLERRTCPIDPVHIPGARLWNNILVKVAHNQRDESIIWTIGDCLIHETLLTEFERMGFTGYQSLPATVRFRNGSTSDQYRELIVTGWAGTVHPESGIQHVHACPACRCQTYERPANVKKLIDWDQWTGDHFFRVWPFPKFVFVTEQVAEFLKGAAPRSFEPELCACGGVGLKAEA